MAYPYLISSSLLIPDSVVSEVGPHDYNGTRFQSFYDYTNENLEVHKSTDQGQTWSECDAANHPVAHNGADNGRMYGAHRDESELHFTFRYSGGSGALGIVVFDMATETWGSVITGGPTPFGSPTITGALTRAAYNIIHRYGSHVVFYPVNSGDGFGTPKVNGVVYNGSWGTPFEVFPTGGSFFGSGMSGAYLNPTTDRIHAIGINGNRELWHRSLSSADVLGPLQAIPTSVANASQIQCVGLGIVYERDSKTYIAFPFSGGSRLHSAASITPTPVVAIAESLEEPVWEVRTVSGLADDIRIPEVLATMASSCVYDGDALHIVWVTNDNRIMHSCYKGKSWATPDQLDSLGANNNNAVARVISSGVIGVLLGGALAGTYNDAYYHQFNISCSADSCGSASTGGVLTF